MKGRISSLQRMSVHDGPGIRTVVFMKGCNMRCRWCHNPETWSSRPQLQYISSRCICCGTCIGLCPDAAIWPGQQGIKIDYSSCIHCGKCAESCCTGALSLIGESLSPEECWDRIRKDLPFFRSSQGGVTISGGEPLMQSQFVKELLAISKENQVHTAIESNMSGEWEIIERLSPYVDLWMCDLKMADSGKHKKWTGINNENIISNIGKLAERHVPLIVRTPVIPGVNDTEEDIEDICRILSPFSGQIRYELLEFHQLGFSKYEQLGMENGMKEVAAPDKKHFEKLKEIPHKYRL